MMNPIRTDRHRLIVEVHIAVRPSIDHSTERSDGPPPDRLNLSVDMSSLRHILKHTHTRGQKFTRYLSGLSTALNASVLVQQTH